MLQKYSICICNYNMGRTLETAIKSILDQLNFEFEVILVDDRSTDKSIEIVKKLRIIF